MKRLLLFSIYCTLFIGLSGQKIIVRINEPNNLKGVYHFFAANFGGSLSGAELTADGACAQPIQACMALTNPSELAGKIALIDRGTCSFDEKCLFAQQAGAVGVVVMNHNDLNNRGGIPFVMGVATQSIADQITIPCVMISYEDGVKLKAACASGAIINLTIGLVPKQEKDIAIHKRNTMILATGSSFSQTMVNHPAYGAIPSAEIKNAGDFNILPGAYFSNDGNTIVQNLDLSVDIQKSNTTIFDHKTNDKISLDPDSISRLQNSNFEFNTVDTSGRVGTYNLTYNIGNGEPDDIGIDNTHSTNFNITNNLFSKCRLDGATKNPNIGSLVWGGQNDYRELMMPILFKNGKSAVLDSLFAYVQMGGGATLANVYLEGRIYKFTDINVDNNISNDELELVALGFTSFPPTFTEASAILRLKLESLVGSSEIYTIEDNNTLFFATIRYDGGSGGIFFGYDMDYHQENNFLLKQSLGTLEITDYPYLTCSAKDAITDVPDIENSAGLFYIDANGSGALDTFETAYFTPSMVLQVSYPPPVNTKDISGELDVHIELSPVPAKDLLVASFSLPTASKVNYQLISSNGQLVFNQDDHVVAKDFKTSFQIGSLPVGTYYLKINTDKGFIKKSFVKMN
ncbi:MAG: T9SS type A sorting domain-containing protein [Saprospiraceae bacterium]|nr:T9SS type A sorting domain-containing protein [Saprospiraceae bacterium]